MPQKFQPKTPALVGALNQAWHIEQQHLPTTVLSYTKYWLDRREGIAGNLRFRSRDSTKQCRLSRIRSSNDADVSKQFHLKNNYALLAHLTNFSKQWLLVD
jgi:hypothetical protein